MKVLCVVGARPNFMKAAPVIEALGKRSEMSIALVHTGQHYDRQMSELFFEQLGMPEPDLHLQVGSGSHGEQTGLIMLRLESVLTEQRPDLVMVFGDVNSTVAAALCAAKLGIKVAHVEAGLRSFDRTMPEELNRILTDHLSDFLFTTEPSARKNLLREGIAEERIFFVGNVMVDTLLKHRERAKTLNMKEEFGLPPRPYGLLTLHRPSNVDNDDTLAGILGAVQDLATELPIVFPCHPRTRQQLEQSRFTHLLKAHEQSNSSQDGRLLVVEPLGYLEFLSLMTDARLVLTDSGGIQEETTVLGVPCLTLRNTTERPVTVTHGTNRVIGTAPARIVDEALWTLDHPPRPNGGPPLWDGRSSERIVKILIGQQGSKHHA
ncbi:MAG: UDP-N-acetylglucosamine 2-epimerase (non-hydrolyzing) [Nitrospirae bacterium]|nr:MAG: UDP-N-acetylglucosamine 2-epimerase (non-hydrolyzing) [Nitrospirota bacterium]TLY45974.1 MAG: UDP-N-acetylglucosamine 2-epimerase (non-hydrolyzing) [Nitrospirota bacterium]